MRDPNRIGRVLEAVRQIWYQNPDLRFFFIIIKFYQLVELIKSRTGKDDLFYLEDKDFIDLVESGKLDNK